MAQLPTNRTSAETAVNHAADHNELHAKHNAYEGAWTNLSPVLSADTTAPTLGAGTAYGHYTRMGRSISGALIFHFGAGMAVGSGTYRFPLPVPAVIPPVDHLIIGTGYVYDSSAVSLGTFELVLNNGLSTHAYGIMHQGSGAPVFITQAAPFPWASGDRLTCNFLYEAVS